MPKESIERRASCFDVMITTDSETQRHEFPDRGLVSLDGPIVVTKFDPSPQRSHLLLRPRLLTKLNRQIEARLTIVTAPAGYGKTTLLAEWRRELNDEETIVGWLSFDEEDIDAAQVARCLTLSLSKAGLSGANELIFCSLRNETEIRQHMITLLNIISVEEKRVILMLDEFEHLAPDLAQRIILPFLLKAPANLHVVTGSRTPPNLQIANLRAQGMVHEINGDELLFTLGEIRALFGNQISDAESRILETQTSGWPVAIQLIKGVWSDSGRRTQVLKDIEALDETLTDYLSEQVFSSLPGKIFDFLVQASLIDRVSPTIVEFMTGEGSAWDMIITAGTISSFLTPLDPTTKQFRMHPIIRTYFYQQLTQWPVQERIETYRKAARWYANANRLISALSCARSAGDFHLIGTLVEEAGGLTLWLRVGLPRLQAVVEYFDERVQNEFPRLKILIALLHAKQGKLSESRALFEEIRQATQNFEQDRKGGCSDTLRVEGYVLESTILINECRAPTEHFLEQYEHSVRAVSWNPDTVLSSLKNLLAISHNQCGYFDNARTEAWEAIEHYRKAGLLHGEFFSHLHIGVAAVAKGKTDEARASFSAAKSLWRKKLNDDKPKLAFVKALLFELEYESSEKLPSVRAMAEVMSTFEHSEWWYDVFAAAANSLVMTLLASQGKDIAIDQLDRCRGLISERQAIGLLPLFDAMEVTCLALSGELALARQKLDENPRFTSSLSDSGREGRSWRQQLAWTSAAARILIREGDSAAAAELLIPETERCLQQAHLLAYIRLGLLQSIALQHLDRREDSLRTLIQVMKTAGPTGYIRAFLEEGQLSRSLLEVHKAALHQCSDQGALLEQLLLFMGSSDSPPDAPLLTDREFMVIQEVARGWTDKEIGKKLDLAPDTIKFHLKNIFRKLGVRNRTHAVTSARRQGLLA